MSRHTEMKVGSMRVSANAQQMYLCFSGRRSIRGPLASRSQPDLRQKDYQSSEKNDDAIPLPPVWISTSVARLVSNIALESFGGIRRAGLAYAGNEGYQAESF